MWMNMHQMGWGTGYGGMFGWTPMLFLLALLILGIALIAKWLIGTRSGEGRSGHTGACEILAERYARGEINRDEFEQKKRELGD